jgi:uncharacterized membrane protein YkoI
MWVRSLLLAAAVLATSAAPALADKGGRHHRDGLMQPDWAFDQRGDRGGDNDRGNRHLDIRSLREIVSMMRGRFGGDLISARLENGDRPFYVLRWRMPNGDVRDFMVDAESGQIR